MSKGCIVGWAHSPFGKLDEPDVESLIARVSGEALTHAGIGHEEVDGIYVGVMNNGFSKQGFEAAQVALNQPELAYVPGRGSKMPARRDPPRSTPRSTLSKAGAGVSRRSSAPKK